MVNTNDDPSRSWSSPATSTTRAIPRRRDQVIADFTLGAVNAAASPSPTRACMPGTRDCGCKDTPYSLEVRSQLPCGGDVQPLRPVHPGRQPRRRGRGLHHTSLQLLDVWRRHQVRRDRRRDRPHPLHQRDEPACQDPPTTLYPESGGTPIVLTQECVPARRMELQRRGRGPGREIRRAGRFRRPPSSSRP